VCRRVSFVQVQAECPITQAWRAISTMKAAAPAVAERSRILGAGGIRQSFQAPIGAGRSQAIP
jgi:hypothetical protein